MNKRHKHYDVIVAWAEGGEVQYRNNYTKDQWIDLKDTPSWDPAFEYRIKPEPKPDVVEECFAGKGFFEWHMYKPNLRLTFDGETGKLKQAEVIDD